MSLPADKQRSRLLGMTLDWLMKRAGLSQGHLEKLINVRLGQMIASGELTYEQARRSGTSQTSISRICEGKIHPGREVLELLVQGLKDWYLSEAYQQRVRDIQKEHPSFVCPQLTDEETADLFHLAGMATPAELEESLGRALQLQPDWQSPLARYIEQRNEALRQKMDGNLSPHGGDTTQTLSVAMPLSFSPSVGHSLLAGAGTLGALLFLHQHHAHHVAHVASLLLLGTK